MTGQLQLELLDDVAGFDKLRHEWDDAVESSADPNVFLTWEWLRTWWRHFGDAATDSRSLHVAVLRDDEGVVAAVPLYRVRFGRGPVRATTLRQISHDAGDFGGIVLVRRHEEAVRRLVDHLADQLRQGVDAVVLSRLASDSVFLASLRTALGWSAGVGATEVDLGDPCPYADLRDGYDLRRHLKKHKVRQRMRRLEEAHADVTFQYHTGDDLELGLQRLVDVHARRWAEQDEEQQGLLADPTHEAFLLDAVRAIDERGWLRLLVVTANNRTVAADLDLQYAGRVSLLKGAFDPNFAEYSPGQLVTYRIFEDSIASGIHEIDFMRGDHPYKRRWTNDERRLVSVTLTRPGLRGRFATTRVRAARALSRG